MAAMAYRPYLSSNGFNRKRPPSNTGQRPVTTGGRRPSSTPLRARATKSMDKQPLQYWNQQARNYDDNIFSTIDEDATGIIAQVIESCGGSGRCIDLGCGAGKYLPTLAKHFDEVKAFDLSPKLVALAEREVKRREIRNVAVAVRDLAQLWYRSDGTGIHFGHLQDMGSFNFAVLANVLIAPAEPSLHQLMLKNAHRSLCPGGRLLCIVPSLESGIYVNQRCEEERYEGPYSVGVNEKPTRSEGADVLKGIMRRSGVRTKHYLEPEFRFLASKGGFEVELVRRVSYNWRSELGILEAQVPPRLRDSPLPWDWLFLLRAEKDASEAPFRARSDDRLPTLFHPKAVRDESFPKLTESQKTLLPVNRASSVSPA